MKVINTPALFSNLQEDTIYTSGEDKDIIFYRLYNGRIYKYSPGDAFYREFIKPPTGYNWSSKTYPKDDFIIDLFSSILMEQLL